MHVGSRFRWRPRRAAMRGSILHAASSGNTIIARRATRLDARSLSRAAPDRSGHASVQTSHGSPPRAGTMEFARCFCPVVGRVTPHVGTSAPTMMLTRVRTGSSPASFICPDGEACPVASRGVAPHGDVPLHRLGHSASAQFYRAPSGHDCPALARGGALCNVPLVKRDRLARRVRRDSPGVAQRLSSARPPGIAL